MMSEPHNNEAIKTPAPAGGEARQPCPMCGEMIVRDALKCRFCGEIFDPELRKQYAKKSAGLSVELVLGYLCGLLAFIFFPPILGPVATVCGIVCWNRGSKGHGAALVILGIAGAIGGMLIAHAIMQALPA